MYYLIHEKAPTIDKNIEHVILESKLILKELNEIMAVNNHSSTSDIIIIRGSEDVLKTLDAILPECLYIEDFLTEDYIPTAKSLQLRCSSMPYEKFITLIAMDSKIDNTKQSISDVKQFHKNLSQFESKTDKLKLQGNDKLIHSQENELEINEDIDHNGDDYEE